jgi:hypothetical protein
MIYSKNDLLCMIYETEEQQEIMCNKFKGYNDLEFIEFAKQYFINIQLIIKNRFVI